MVQLQSYLSRLKLIFEDDQKVTCNRFKDKRNFAKDLEFQNSKNARKIFWRSNTVQVNCSLGF